VVLQQDARLAPVSNPVVNHCWPAVDLMHRVIRGAVAQAQRNAGRQRRIASLRKQQNSAGKFVWMFTLRFPFEQGALARDAPAVTGERTVDSQEDEAAFKESKAMRLLGLGCAAWQERRLILLGGFRPKHENPADGAGFS
jgi:hypothetical protein